MPKVVLKTRVGLESILLLVRVGWHHPGRPPATVAIIFEL